jgi:hypothetical protein
MMMKRCDMCGEEIVDGKCSCGVWFEGMEEHPYNVALREFHKSECMTTSMDAPHLGSAAVFFRGDYNDCMKVREFILKMKGKPHYDG